MFRTTFIPLKPKVGLNGPPATRQKSSESRFFDTADGKSAAFSIKSASEVAAADRKSDV